MQETLIHPPRTMMEVFHSLPEGTWVEVIDGVMSMLPSFSAQHQRVVAKLLMKIDDSCKEHNLGEVMPIIRCLFR